MKQPQVARLELGEVNPSMETLMRVSAQLGIEFTIDVRPAGNPVASFIVPGWRRRSSLMP
jgi:transcriptional regulator with XRE-family HTH domain